MQACAKEGAKVIATDINKEKLAELQGIDGTNNDIFVFLLLNITTLKPQVLSSQNLVTVYVCTRVRDVPTVVSNNHYSR